MATLTLEYNAKNSVARRIIEIILSMDGLFKVKTDVVEQRATTIIDRKKIATAFLDKWAGKFIVAGEKTDDPRYDYLLEKYK